MALKAYPFEKNKIKKQKKSRLHNLATILNELKGDFKDDEKIFSKQFEFIKSYKYDELEDDTNDPLQIRIKRRILIAAGLGDEDPEKLDDKAEISDLLPTDMAYQFLADLLNDLVKEYNSNSSVSSTDVEGCETVADCVSMVEEKINN